MAFFDDLGRKISQTSQGVAQKTKDTAEIYKLNGMISDEEKKLNAVYLQIGKMYFQETRNAPDPKYASLIQEGTTAINNMAAYSDQVKKLKGIVSCPQCGMDVAANATFCSGCGCQMNGAAAASSNSICTGCGARLEPGTRFCAGCGKSVVTEAPAPAPVAPAPAPVAPAPAPVAPAPAPVAPAPAPIPTPVPTPVAAPVAPVQPSARICTKCGAQYPADDDTIFCSECGGKL